jgi:hypothetical protein
LFGTFFNLELDRETEESTEEIGRLPRISQERGERSRGGNIDLCIAMLFLKLLFISRTIKCVFK